ncbi:hypothetical protein OUZ56_028918 [Daphnia magna]|uniref:Uncharacterized protein n=1 Tax=Daphnia magna TaxID=35525 RepID=A0ABR0B5A9_9CRUS|nr:hypothetical protein OUZ56_028918 [Daphnia magna]
MPPRKDGKIERKWGLGLTLDVFSQIMKMLQNLSFIYCFSVLALRSLLAGQKSLSGNRDSCFGLKWDISGRVWPSSPSIITELMTPLLFLTMITSNRLFSILIDYNKPNPHLSCKKGENGGRPSPPTLVSSLTPQNRLLPQI